MLAYENIAVVFEHTNSEVLCEHKNGVNSEVTKLLFFFVTRCIRKNVQKLLKLRFVRLFEDLKLSFKCSTLKPKYVKSCRYKGVEHNYIFEHYKSLHFIAIGRLN